MGRRFGAAAKRPVKPRPLVQIYTGICQDCGEFRSPTTWCACDWREWWADAAREAASEPKEEE